MVSPLRRVTFNKRPEAGPVKSNQKRSPLTYGPSLGLGVPSLRHSSGGIASGLLRDDLLSMCAAPPHGATRLPPDKRLHSACRWAGGSKTTEAAYRPTCLFCSAFQTVGASLLAMAPTSRPDLAGFPIKRSANPKPLLCFQICVAQNFHNASKTIRPRRHRRTVINGNAAVDRATFAHRVNPGAEYWPIEGKAQLYLETSTSNGS